MKPKITTGKYKNKILEVPDGARPITSRMKRSIFDTITSSFEIKDLTFADLFSGSASLGIEALSRGAKYVFFLDTSGEAIKLIKQNLENFGVEKERYSARKGFFKTFLNNSSEKFDIIFVDPPYPSIERVRFDKLPQIMHDSSVAVLKAPSWFGKKFEKKYELIFEMILEKKFGKNSVIYFRLK